LFFLLGVPCPALFSAPVRAYSADSERRGGGMEERAGREGGGIFLIGKAGRSVHKKIPPTFPSTSPLGRSEARKGVKACSLTCALQCCQGRDHERERANVTPFISLNQSLVWSHFPKSIEFRLEFECWRYKYCLCAVFIGQ